MGDGRAKIRGHHYSLQIASVLIVLLMVTPTFIMPFSAPIFSNVVVVMHDDSATNEAISAITDHVPGIKVVEYSSLDYILTVHRTFGIVIWISHGSEQGIATYQGVLDWKQFSSLTRLTPGKDIILACESQNIYDYVDRNNAVAFSGTVDALVAGYLVSLYLLQIACRATEVFASVLEKALSRIMGLLAGTQIPITLSIQQKWAQIRIPLIGILTGLFFLGAYYIKWQAYGWLGALATMIAGTVAGFIFQWFLEALRISLGGLLSAINPFVGNTFNSVIGFLLGFVISAVSPLLLPSVLGVVLYRVCKTTIALALSETPDFWIRLAATTAFVIGLLSIIDAIIQFA